MYTRILFYTLLLSVLTLSVGCEEDESPIVQAQLATLITTHIRDLTATSARSGGIITSVGSSAVTERGVCWRAGGIPTIADSKTVDGAGEGEYSSEITGLVQDVTYSVRAYATNSVGTAYGEVISFEAANVPILSTVPVTNIAYTSAVSGGVISSHGGRPVQARGVCWSTGANPTTANNKTTDGFGEGTYSSSITGLVANTTYHVRAYATNVVGTAYGNDLTFQTPALPLPTLTTAPMSNVTGTTATSGGTITNDGGQTVTARGVCWSTGTTPTIADSRTTDGAGVGTYVSNLTGLVPATQYYVRAYATTNNGTGYGPTVSFVSLTLPSVITFAISNVSKVSAASGGEVAGDGGQTVTQRGVCWSTSPNPTIAGNRTIDGSGTGSFSSNLTGLSADVIYYVRAYATNANGTAYGNERSFRTLLLKEDFSSGVVPPGWVNSGNAGWFVEFGYLRSGAITHYQNSAVTVTVNFTGTRTLSFIYATSSEPTHDLLKLFVNGVEVQRWGGNQPTFAPYSTILNGTGSPMALKWEYSKDGSDNTGLDLVAIDNVEIR